MDKSDHLNDKGVPYDTPETISIPVWTKKGIMRVNRNCLDHGDPDHTYNYCKNVLNVRPENYGIEHPLVREFGEKSREELIDEILQLRAECISWQMYGP